MITSDSEYMQLALSAARKAASRGEIPVGAVIVLGGQVIATAYNDREERQTPLGHDGGQVALTVRFIEMVSIF